MHLNAIDIQKEPCQAAPFGWLRESLQALKRLSTLEMCALVTSTKSATACLESEHNGGLHVGVNIV
jgi:hypothetical protein